ncbi:polyprenyl synthetase family protein [Actinoplanes sp. RD1]|uniref:polyprenyl synthetase family protein n=1 Tax=Actinoplanes sp. RD1 TaxID=3064538 RepID=UPI00274215C4|nr:polyprenyl synthetase family protein [Actinoplanes sp. RD1]
MRQRVSELEPTLARIGLYHLGFADEQGAPSTGGDGKLTRTSLITAAAQGVGLAPEDVLSQAAALELFHNSTLIHDDIIDGDDLRRGRPAAWRVFGTGLAILAGNALENLALRMVMTDTGAGREPVSRAFAEAIGRVHDGQAREIVFRPGPGATTAEYDRIVAGKASALLEWSLTTPAVQAGEPEEVLAALRAAGRHLGAGLQMSNDVEDIWGDTAVTGKGDRGDIKRRNLTFPVVLALSADCAAGRALARLWQADDTTDAHLQAMADLIEEAGGRRTATQLAQDHLARAVENLARAHLAEAATDELTTLFDRIVNRTA